VDEVVEGSAVGFFLERRGKLSFIEEWEKGNYEDQQQSYLSGEKLGKAEINETKKTTQWSRWDWQVGFWSSRWLQSRLGLELQKWVVLEKGKEKVLLLGELGRPEKVGFDLLLGWTRLGLGVREWGVGG